MDLHKNWGLKAPKHPLISVVQINAKANIAMESSYATVIGFYCICIKKNGNRLRYGQSYYDFNSGVMSFLSPHQVLEYEEKGPQNTGDISLVFHPDFLRGFPLAATMRNYNFFSYGVNEALHLSAEEEETVQAIFNNIEKEYHSAIDNNSQKIIITQIELLLQYADRFYNRQFIMRKIANDEILTRLEFLLADYIDGDKIHTIGLPTVQYLAKELAVSADYLSDALRSVTGQNTQQHIHNKLIEKAKILLSTTNLSVKEIAYELGFEYPQSFHKLFKNKTYLSPMKFRKSFYS